MNKKIHITIFFFLAAGFFHCEAASQRKRNISVEDATRAISEVVSEQPFPADTKLLKMGSLRVKGVYYHIFSTYLKKTQRWRTLVFANSGNYMGYYETIEEPTELDAGAIIYSSSSSSEAETDEDGTSTIISSESSMIEFTRAGPPDLADLDEETYSFVSSPTRTRPEDPSHRFVIVVERLVDAMNRHRYQRIRDDFSEKARGKLSEEQTQVAFRNLHQKFGEVEHLGAPLLRPPDIAVFPITFEKEVMGLKVKLNDDDEIVELSILPGAIAFPSSGSHSTVFTLPFDGRWLVLWGGDTKNTNRHYGSRSQQYAIEFVISDRHGRQYKKDGKWKNEEYFAFGRPVLAPAAGKVIGVIQGVEDNKPGSPNPSSALGNTVIIQHSTNEVSVLSHLKYKSIVVKVGDEVAARQPIGQCGNSGDTTEPRIHMHLQNTPLVQAGSGYRLVFDQVLVWTKGQARGLETHTPYQGEYVEYQPLRPEETAPARDGVEAEQASK